MATTKTISAALKLIDAKKENLRKAFEDLQSHSSSLSSSFSNLTWSDLDSHFSSLQSSLEHKFKILLSQQQQLQQQSHPSSTPTQPQPQPQPQPQSQPIKESSDSAPVPARPELKSFCEKKDGLGLRNYIVARPKERNAIRDELPEALRCSPEAAAAMVLDAMEGFYVPNLKKGDKDIELCTIRRSCVVLLDGLRGSKVGIGAEVREKARKLAAEWKGKVSVDGENPLEALAFFHLIAAYGLGDGFNAEELVDFGVVIARFREAVELFRVIGFGHKISDLIVKLVSVGKQLVAVKFIFEFELSDKFPPVPILEEYVKESKRIAKKAVKGKTNSIKAQNEAATKEVNALKNVIKVIEDHKLESMYPKEKLVKRLETLEKLKSERKRPAPAPAPETQQQSKPQNLSGSKRPRTAAPAGPAATPTSVATTSTTVPAFQNSHPQRAGLLPEHLPPYLSSAAGPYGLAGSASAVAPYAVSSAGLYGSTGAPLGDHGNLMASQSHVYPSESHMPTGYYDRPVAYGGYAYPPQYRPTYYPQ